MQLKISMKSILLASCVLVAGLVGAYTLPIGVNEEQNTAWTAVLDLFPQKAAASAITGAWTHTGLETGFRRDLTVATTITNAVTTAMSGKLFIGTASSGTQVYNLPAATTAGVMYGFKCGHASGEILVNGTGTDTFQINASNGGAVITTASSTGIKNTAATNVVGDYIWLIADGTSQWYATSQGGIWASQ